MISDVQDFEDSFSTQEFQDIISTETHDKTTCTFYCSPFRQQAQLPAETPFWWAWEIHRVAHERGIEPLVLHNQMLEALRYTNPSADEFRETLSGFTIDSESRETPIKSDLPEWMTSGNEYYNKKLNVAASLKLTLRWTGKLRGGRFEYHLNPIQLDKSCRLQRRFGADRFLVISARVPGSYTSIQQNQYSKDRSMKDYMCTWLTASEHVIAGRYWKVYFGEQGSNIKLEGRDGRIQEFKLYLFAETGFDMIPRSVWSALPLEPTQHEIMLEELIQWHIPLQPNLASTDLKLFSRWSIVISKTTPTIALQRSEFIPIDNVLGEPMADGRQEVMNDGCALISLAYAREVWKSMGKIGEVPSAVQGRIGGAKGLWIVDFHNTHPGVSERDFWIEVSPSQLKIKPHPREREADETQRTFEVLKWASAAKEGALNKQLIAILADRGVNRDVLKAKMMEDVSEVTDSLFTAMDDPMAMAAWVQSQSRSSQIGVAKAIGCMPTDQKEQANKLLHAGFQPQTSPMLVKLAKDIQKNYLDRYVGRLRIKIPHSSLAFCAVDPIGVLEPGQIHLAFLNPRTHPISGFSENYLDEIDVLVARNPAYLASDIQMVRAVYKPELRHYKDLILFPRKGQIPLASLLSGGDYDGDTVVIIWDPSIVKDFKNSGMPRLPSAEECGLINRSRRLSEFFQKAKPMRDEVQRFTRSCLDFNLSETFKGRCSDEHEQVSYALSIQRAPLGLSDPVLIKLAAAAGYLVDASKQGWEPNIENWIATLSKGKRLRRITPAHKGSSKGISDQNGQQENIIDYLKFDVATTTKDSILGKFETEFSKRGEYDPDLSRRWNYWKAAADDTLKCLLFDETDEMSLVRQVRAVRDSWTKVMGRRHEDTQPTRGSSATFAEAVETVFDEFKGIKPARVDHEFYRQYEYETDEKFEFSEWSLLRASCLYYVLCNGAPNNYQSLLWHIAGDELCRIKGNTQRGTQVVVPEMLANLRFDGKRHKHLLERQALRNGNHDVASNIEGIEESDDDEEE